MRTPGLRILYGLVFGIVVFASALATSSNLLWASLIGLVAGSLAWCAQSFYSRRRHRQQGTPPDSVG